MDIFLGKAQQEISEYLQIPMAEIYGVITFYSRFTLNPKGKYHIAVCLGTACYVKGSQKIFDRLKERLKIEEGQTTEDGLISIGTHAFYGCENTVTGYIILFYVP